MWPQTRGAWRQPLASGGVKSRATGGALNEGSAPAGPRPVPNRSAKLDGGRQSSVEWRDFKFGLAHEVRPCRPPTGRHGNGTNDKRQGAAAGPWRRAHGYSRGGGRGTWAAKGMDTPREATKPKIGQHSGKGPRAGALGKALSRGLYLSPGKGSTQAGPAGESPQTSASGGGPLPAGLSARALRRRPPQ